MDTSTAKVLSFAIFIALGYVLRRTEILKSEAFHAISGLVMCVTLPCVVFVGLNGVSISGPMIWVAGLGFLSNVLLLLYARMLTMRHADADKKAFEHLNLCGFSIGPFAIPYIQAFFPGTGLLTALIFDVGNCVMSAGGTYAVVAAQKENTKWTEGVKLIASKLVRSGPTLAFVFMTILYLFGLTLPDAVITCAQVGASANTFLCMIMIGESVTFASDPRILKRLFGLLGKRFVVQILLAAAFYYLLPFEHEVRVALALVALSPIPAMNLIYTAKLKGDIGLAANLNSMSVAVAIISMSVLIAFIG
ncbi:AEC family transporter [Sutterella parvirubra]|uniref:Transporter, auxin efflux carrier family protein n=1 Tax=Sutterella parvirubra YIT 11816 TaxID=762967 RepID=H3KGK4_9BURK|nr:transporter [Sutterella parvirubra]EHY30743.1 transporter, auxin efflux carrier family protein [Sutterella parvirubra YIT 11816]